MTIEPTRHTVSAGGTSLSVDECGAGPAVLFGHGLLYDRTVFDPHAAALADRYRAIRLDFRAHGESGIPDSAWTIQDLARDYVTVMDALSVEGAVLVGHSMGGMAALHAALMHPDRVGGLVLVDTSAARDRLGARLRYRALAASAALVGIRPFHMRQATPIMFGRTYRRSDPEGVRYWTARAARMDRRAVWRAVDATVGRPRIVDRLRKIQVPALVIVGDEDQTTPPAVAQQMGAALPDARIETLPDTGHMSIVERPQETAGLIRRFLEETGW